MNRSGRIGGVANRQNKNGGDELDDRDKHSPSVTLSTRPDAFHHGFPIP